MALDICFDVKTFLERTCRACSRYFDDVSIQGVRFYKIFTSEEQPCDDISEIYDELEIWKLNIKPKDSLPQQICNDCFERFLGVKAFREECLDTQKVLESYFKDFEHLTEATSNIGRLSPKADSIKSEPHDEQHLALAAAPDDSPKVNFGSPKCADYNDEFYAESFMGTPPPLFEEIRTEPIDMWTLDSIKSEAELKPDGSPKIKIKSDNNELLYKIPTTKGQKPAAHYTSSDDESSTPTSDEEDDGDTDDDDDDDTVGGATTENDDVDVVRKRQQNANNKYVTRNTIQCNICFAAFPKRKMLKEHHTRAHPQEKPYVCNVCGKAFKSNFLLKQHQVQHNRPDTIKCDLCGKYFRSQLHLQRHAKNFHLTSTYTCHICHEKFENYTQIRFQYHVRQHGEKRFQCIFCDKSFHQKIHLINHERTHSKEQPFSCDICGKSYRQQTACQEHMLTHQDPTPFKCKVCEKGFTQRSSLRLHYRTHDRKKLPNQQQQKQQQQTRHLQCKFCGQNFTQKLEYDVHQQTHGNNCSIFTCSHCNATFKEKSYLERHVQSMHSKKRKCAHCGDVYSNELALKAHLKTHVENLNNTYEQQVNEDDFEKIHRNDRNHRTL